MCSAGDATDSKKRCGEWVGTEQPSFDAKHCQCKQSKQSKVEIQAKDVSDISSPVYHMLKRSNQHRLKRYFRIFQASNVILEGALYSPRRSSEIMAKHSLFQLITVT